MARVGSICAGICDHPTPTICGFVSGEEREGVTKTFAVGRLLVRRSRETEPVTRSAHDARHTLRITEKQVDFQSVSNGKFSIPFEHSERAAFVYS